MNNQIFHIKNHWALEKNRKNLEAQVYFDENSGINLFLPAKSLFASPVRKKNVFSTFWQKPANPVPKPPNATHSARPMGQPGCGRRLPQPG